MIVLLFTIFRLQTVACMPPPVSSAVILTKAVGGNEVNKYMIKLLYIIKTLQADLTIKS